MKTEADYRHECAEMIMEKMRAISELSVTCNGNVSEQLHVLCRGAETLDDLFDLYNASFTDAQEKRIREIIREELPKFEIDSDCGATIVNNRLQQLENKVNA